MGKKYIYNKNDLLKFTKLEKYLNYSGNVSNKIKNILYGIYNKEDVFFNIYHFFYVLGYYLDRIGIPISVSISRSKLGACGYITSKNVGFLWLPDLEEGNVHSKNAVNNCIKILNYFYENNVENVILDLRGNGGGSLEYFFSAICPLADTYLAEGVDKNGNINSTISANGEEFRCEANGETILEFTFPHHKLLNFTEVYTLMGKDSASASEFVALILCKAINAKIDLQVKRTVGISTLMEEVNLHGLWIVYPYTTYSFLGTTSVPIPNYLLKI